MLYLLAEGSAVFMRNASLQDLRIPAINVGAIRESPLHLGLDKAICVSPKLLTIHD